jgi:hypothetical protein
MAKKAPANTPMMDDSAEEAAEKPGENSLTPLGRRTLAGFKKRYGEEDGETKFEAALKAGTIDRKKMKG